MVTLASYSYIYACYHKTQRKISVTCVLHAYASYTAKSHANLAALQIASYPVVKIESLSVLSESQII